jgi:hypothetical protein
MHITAGGPWMPPTAPPDLGQAEKPLTSGLVELRGFEPLTFSSGKVNIHVSRGLETPRRNSS